MWHISKQSIQFHYLKSLGFFTLLFFFFFFKCLGSFFPVLCIYCMIQNNLNKRRKQFCKLNEMPFHWWFKNMGIFIFWSFAVKELKMVGEAYQMKRRFYFACKLKWAWTWLTVKSSHCSSHMDVHSCICGYSAQKGKKRR